MAFEENYLVIYFSELYLQMHFSFSILLVTKDPSLMPLSALMYFLEHVFKGNCNYGCHIQ